MLQVRVSRTELICRDMPCATGGAVQETRERQSNSVTNYHAKATVRRLRLFRVRGQRCNQNNGEWNTHI